MLINYLVVNSSLPAGDLSGGSVYTSKNDYHY